MLRLTPILLAVALALLMYFFSAWRLKGELDRRSTPLADPALRRITDTLARAAGLPRLRVHVYETPAINGLAAPDGRIFITRGFLKQYHAGRVTDEELGSVIAHELGHVALNHSQRRMLDFSAHNAIRAILTMILARFIPFVGVYIASFLSQMLAARLSRQDEYEADAYAAALMQKSGIGVYPQISLLRKLHDLSGGAPGQLAWLMSHPQVQDRIDAIRVLESRWTGGPVTPDNDPPPGSPPPGLPRP